MDEPTNHLDIHSKEVIKEMLSEFEWMTMVVSHDRDLLVATSNKVWHIIDGMLVEYREPEAWFDAVFQG
jgi:ATP-binding cassette subfamily F protein 3